jgi:hypothetical protein
MESLSGKKEKYEPDGRCCAILKNKSRCPNPTSEKSDYWCNVHLPECMRKRVEMKTICNNIKKCSKDDNLTSLILSKKVLEECLSKRLNLNKTCYHETVQDLRHLRFIMDLDKNIGNCNQLIEQQEMKKQTKQEKKLESKREKEAERERLREKQESTKQESEDLAQKISSLNIIGSGSGSVKKKKTKPKVSEESLLEEMKSQSDKQRKAMTLERFKELLNIIQDKINALTYIHSLGNTRIGKNVLKNYNDLVDDIKLYFDDPENEKLITQIEKRYQNLDQVEQPIIKIITESLPAFEEKTKVYKSILLMLLYSLDSLNFVIDTYSNQEIDLETYDKFSKVFDDFYIYAKDHLEKANKIGYNDIESYKTLFKKIDPDLREILNYISLSDDPFINQLYKRVSKFVKTNMLESEEFNNDIYQYYFEIRKYIDTMINFRNQLQQIRNDMSSYKSK